MIEIYDSGIDWLTMTWARELPTFYATQSALQSMGIKLKNAGFETKPAFCQGYAGLQFGTVFLGQRDDGIMLRASGENAKTAAAEIKGNGIAGKATRLDFQTTIKDGAAQTNLGCRVRKAIEAHQRKQRPSARRNVASYQTTGCDSGLAIGSRSSQCYARFYNKTLEQRGRVDAGLWRYEIEYKGGKARHAWQTYEETPNAPVLAQSVVKTEFEHIGVNMSRLKRAPSFQRASSYNPTSIEKKLAWFQNFVSPSVRECIEAGKLDEVLETLGLTDYVRPV